MKKLLSLVIIFACLTTSTYAMSADLQNARNDFTFQLDIYRQADTQFRLHKRDFEQNDTFANLELLVDSARELLGQRAKTWDTYWQALRIDVLDQTDLAEAIKKPLTERIQTEQKELKDHQTKLKTLVTRETLLTEAQIFNSKNSLYKNLSYESLIAIRLSSLQKANREIEAFMNQIKKASLVQIRDATIRDERIRGIDESLQTLAQNKASLNVLSESNLGSGKIHSENTFEKLNQEFMQIFDSTSLMHQRATELSEGLEI